MYTILKIVKSQSMKRHSESWICYGPWEQSEPLRISSDRVPAFLPLQLLWAQIAEAAPVQTCETWGAGVEVGATPRFGHWLEGLHFRKGGEQDRQTWEKAEEGGTAGDGGATLPR